MKKNLFWFGLLMSLATAGHAMSMAVGRAATAGVSLSDANTWTAAQTVTSTVTAFAVGIGTGVPQGAKIQVHDPGANAVGMRFTNSNTGATSSDGLFVGLASGGQATIFSLDSTSLQLGTSNNNSMFIMDSTGKVGFGNNPTSAFDPFGTIGLYSRTTAQLAALAPGKAGEITFNSDTGRTCVCLSTGTGTGAWVVASATGTACDQ